MNLAKISANGQITVPIEIRKLLKLKTGDKILFYQKQDGDIVLSNASAKAILKAQIALPGMAEALEIQNATSCSCKIEQILF